MKIKKPVTVPIVCLILAFDIGSLSAQQLAGRIFEKALFLEEAEGDLQKAIALYVQITRDYGHEMPIAAKAQLHIGYCYEKLGKKQAVQAYETVVDRYRQMPEAVAEARIRLSVLRRERPTTLSLTRLPAPQRWLECQALSPDAAKIAGIDMSDGQNLAVFDLATGQTDLLTDYQWRRNSCSTYAPVWSPDSKELLHLVVCWGDSSQKEEQLRITLLNGVSRLLYRNSVGAGIAPCDWLPDKSAILACYGSKPDSFHLVLISTQNGSMRKICALQRRFPGLDSPMWKASLLADISPDSRFIAYADGPQNGNRDIFTVSLDGGAGTCLVDHPADEREPRWSPDGRHLVFLSNRHGSWALWGVALRNCQTAGAPFMILEGLQDTELTSWTKSGLASRTIANINDIYAVDIDPVRMIALTEPKIMNIPLPPGGFGVRPLWSPNGRYLAARYYTKQPESSGQSFLFFTPSGKIVQEFNYTPTVKLAGGTWHWLPDGSALGLVFWDQDKQLYFSRLELASGEWKTREIAAGEFSSMRSLVWSADGKSFFYIRIGAGAEAPALMVHDVETGRERCLLQPHAEGDPSGLDLNISRDYRRLACKWGKKIILVDVDTGQLQQIACDEKRHLSYPVWAPDGKHLLVAGVPENGEEPNELYVFSLRSGEFQSLGISRFLPRNASIHTSADWSPDGRMIVFHARTWISETNLMQNLFSEK